MKESTKKSYLVSEVRTDVRYLRYRRIKAKGNRDIIDFFEMGKVSGMIQQAYRDNKIDLHEYDVLNRYLDMFS